MKYDDKLAQVLDSAVKLQGIVPGAVLVGGTASALYAEHRQSMDHDHVLNDLSERFDLVLDALEREGEWVTNRVVPGKIILGQLGEIEAGVRQLIRKKPLEIINVEISAGVNINVPTLPELIRIKAFLITKRNQLRDYLDLAALSKKEGISNAAKVLERIDEYYTDTTKDDKPLASQLVRQLANPNPKDVGTIKNLSEYKGIKDEWKNWDSVKETCEDIAREMIC